MSVLWTHRLVDSFAEDAEDEDGCDRRCEVAGDGLDVVEELAALGRLHHGDPGYADSDQAQDEQSANTHGQKVTFKQTLITSDLTETPP